MGIVKEGRRKRAMTQLHLAQAAGIDARTVRKIEKGERVSPESLSAVCAVLTLDPASVLADSAERSERDVASAPLETIPVAVAGPAKRTVARRSHAGRIVEGSGLVAACACLVLLVQAFVAAGDSQMYLGRAASVDLHAMAGSIRTVVEAGPDERLRDDPVLAAELFRSSMVVREGDPR